MDRLMRLAIGVPPVILRTPLHGVMSRDLVSITFRGRASGKAYTATANYLREGDALVVTTAGRWWRNLRGGAPVTVRLRGRDVAGVAEAVTDPAEVERVLRAMLARFPRYGKFARVGVGPGGNPDPADIARAIANGRVVVRVRLDEERSSPGPGGADRSQGRGRA